MRMWELDTNSNQKFNNLDEVKDAVDFLWEGLDAIDDKKCKRRKIKIRKTERG